MADAMGWQFLGAEPLHLKFGKGAVEANGTRHRAGYFEGEYTDGGSRRRRL